MAFRWFRLPETTDVEGHAQPKYHDEFEQWAGRRVANSPRYVIKAEADEATLDAVESNTDVQALSDGQIENALNPLLGLDRGADWYNKTFGSGRG